MLITSYKNVVTQSNFILPNDFGQNALALVQTWPSSCRYCLTSSKITLHSTCSHLEGEIIQNKCVKSNGKWNLNIGMFDFPRIIWNLMGIWQFPMGNINIPMWNWNIPYEILSPTGNYHISMVFKIFSLENLIFPMGFYTFVLSHLPGVSR